jgi:phosphate-transporting ATPase
MLQVKSLQRVGISVDGFDLQAGECVSLSGPSGSGKTLFLRAIADLDENQGDLYLNGVSRDAMTGPNWRRQISYLAAEPGWWADRIGDHFPNWPVLSDDLAALGLINGAKDWLVSQASTGERQRLALLRSLALTPKVLLLDEPTAALDNDTTTLVEQLIQTYRSAGLAVIWATHDPTQALRVADRHLRMENGKVALQ